SEDDDSPVSTSVDTLTRGELLGFNTSAFFSANDAEGVADVRLRMERTDVDGKAFGDSRLPVTDFSIGDVFTPSLNLLTNLQDVWGVQVSNFPLERAGQFNRVTVRSDILPYGEVELDHNDILL